MNNDVENRFNRLLKAMTEGEPPTSSKGKGDQASGKAARHEDSPQDKGDLRSGE